MSDESIDRDKQQIARQFSRAAASYDLFSQLQVAMSVRLMQMVSPAIEPQLSQTWIDLGCGTGVALQRILQTAASFHVQPDIGGSTSGQRGIPPNRQVGLRCIGIDLAAGMIQQAQSRLAEFPNVELLVGDMEATELPDGIADYIYSCASLQWCDAGRVLGEVNRLLKPDRQLLVATFGPATMERLRSVYRSIGEINPPIHSFDSLQELTAQLQQTGLCLIDSVSENVSLRYNSPPEMLRSIKGLGATHAGNQRRTGLAGKERWLRLCQQIEQQMSREGQIELTFETIYLNCRKLH
jgi:malonyl-CoA O-methyltransferase